MRSDIASRSNPQQARRRLIPQMTKSQVVKVKSSSRQRKRRGKMGSFPRTPTNDKSLQKTKPFCRDCGIEGHKQESCSKAFLKFHNTSPMDYDKSPPWAEVLKEFPRILEVMPNGRPRIPSSLHLKELALLTGTRKGVPESFRC